MPLPPTTGGVIGRSALAERVQPQRRARSDPRIWWTAWCSPTARRSHATFAEFDSPAFAVRSRAHGLLYGR